MKLLVTPHVAAPATMARPRRRSSGELGDNSIELLNCWLIRMADNGVLLLGILTADVACTEVDVL